MLLWDFLADRDTPSRKRLIATLSQDLRARLGADGRVIDSVSGRELYSRDLADLPRWMEKALFRTTPHLAVQPADTRQIAVVMEFAAERGIPLVPRGIASTAFGGPVPTSNGIVLDLSPMRGIEPLSPGQPAMVTLQAGARFGDVEDRVAPLGYTLAVYPSNRLGTVGGWLASGGYGVNALKYGHAGRWVEALEVVTMDGAARWLRNGEGEFDRFLGTEGQVGVISRATLRLLTRPALRIPHLLAFESDGAALDFVGQLSARGVLPATVTFLAAELLRQLNQIHRADHGEEGYLPERPSLLIYCDDAEAESGLRAALSGRSDLLEADRERAGHLWAERYFPMKTRRLGPSLLAGQVVLPLEKTPGFLAEARRTAARWGMELATEAHILPPAAGYPPEGTGSCEGLRTLAILMFPTDSRKAFYLGHTIFVSLLDHLGSRWGGQPYNVGIWHAPFIGEKRSREDLDELLRAKRALDPRGLLNPGKLPGVRSRFGGLSGLPFQPPLFKLGMGLVGATAPLIGSIAGGRSRRNGSAPPLARHLQGDHDGRFHVAPEPPKLPSDPSEELLLSALQCTSCGNCISVCPAYLHTHDERTTARGKLWLGRRLAQGKPIDREEAELAFLCMRCRACSEVCQVQLPLMDAWEQLESLLAARCGRPQEEIRRFLAGVERNPEYLELISLQRPGGVLAQEWMKQRETPSPARSRAETPSAEVHEEPAPPQVDHGGRFHIELKPAQPVAKPFGKFRIQRSDFCVNCGHCGEACVYGVHFRNPADPRRMSAPVDYQCRACFRCTMECPRQALSISINPAFTACGRGPYTDEIVYSLARQADEGRIPVTGAGYRGPFAGDGFEGMWTDMSEIVRPTRDGIHGREYISTAIDVGRRPLRLSFGEHGELATAVPSWLEIPIPVLFGPLPIHAEEPRVAESIRRAAAELHTFVLGRTDPSEGIAQVDDADDVMDRIMRIKAAHPRAVVVVRLPLGAATPLRAEELTRAGVEALHLAANWDGVCGDGTPLHEALPMVHRQLVSANLRDGVTLLVGGGIAAAEHLPKAVILGADGVVIDLPLLAALECPLSDACFRGEPCPAPLVEIDPRWGQQRIVNLMASWRNQLLEVLGAMGMREVRRLRGERGRAMFADKLEAELFAPLFQ